MQDLPEQAALDQDQQDAEEARRARLDRLRRGALWYLSVLLIALLIGLMIGRVVNGQIPWSGQLPEPPGLSTQSSLPKIFAVQAQEREGELWLRLSLEQKVPYRRIEEDAAVSFELPAVRLQGAMQSGRMQLDGRSLSWKVQQQGAEVQVLIVGLGAEVEAEESWHELESGWELLFKVDLVDPPAQVDLVSVTHLPVAQELAVDEGLLSARWASLQSIEQALALGQFEQAFEEWQALQPVVDVEVEPELLHALAAAYLGQGREADLLKWLPNQLALHASDHRLRQLYAQALAQADDWAGAVGVLAQQPPSLLEAPEYHSLWAQFYQRNGQWQESVALYQPMLALRPGQATWQYGIAMGFDQLQRYPQALKHYRLALEAEQLDESTRELVRQRIKQLSAK